MEHNVDNPEREREKQMQIPPMEEIFGPSGKLAEYFPTFEYRKQQVDLAEEVRLTLQNGEGEILAAEAPPGVGKTFALLVPAMISAAAEGKKILFLTAGIPLQEQLIEKDLPVLNRLLGLSLPFGLLKGKGNYACLLKAGESGETGDGKEGYLSFHDGGAASGKIAEWLRTTETGDLSEVSLPPDSPALLRIAASSRACLGSSCPFRDRCFVRKSLRDAQEWSVIVANYHLFFSYLLGAGKQFPVQAEILICDEAHRIPEAARSSMALSVSADEFARLLRNRAVQDGAALIETGATAGKTSGLAGEVRLEAARFFDLLEIKCPANKASFTSRNEELWHQQAIVREKTDELLRLFSFLEDRLDDPDPEHSRIAVWMDELKRAADVLAWCTETAGYPSWAYWKEGRSLSSAPASPLEELSECFQSFSPETAVFVSATLAPGGKWEYWTGETGIAPARFFISDSPFRLEEQMEIVVVDTGLEVMDPCYDGTVCAVIEKLVEANGGSTLVLLSSLRLLRKTAETLRSRKRAYTVLVQGELPRTELLRAFRDEHSSVLVGSASFREGVDIPGEGLTQVIIDRIPFPHPADPLVQARNALFGGRSFAMITLPEAKMLLKQAAGRLIRSSEDRGRVVILDGRVLSRKDWNIPGALPAVKYRRLVVPRQNVSKSVAQVRTV